MRLIPLAPVPSQNVKVTLNDQLCSFNVYQKFYGLFVDVLVNGNLLIGGVIAQDLNRIVRSVYLGFSGDLIFADSQGSSDPHYTGLGSAGARYEFLYLSPDDLVSLGLVE